MNSLLDNIERVSVDDVRPYPRNPRIGNVEEIMASLRENGQFAPLVVQKSTRYILSGNHTFEAAMELGWVEIDVVFIDVTDTQAKRILLAANRIADLGTYDQEILAQIVSEVVETDVALLEGTGYSSEEVDSLLESTILMDLSDEDAGEGVEAAASVLDRIMPNEDEDEDEDSPDTSSHPFGAPSRSTVGATQTDFVIFRFGELRAKVTREAYEAFFKMMVKEYDNIGDAGVRAAVQMGLEEEDVDLAVAQGAERWL